MALRDMGSLVCVYHSMQQVGLARSELGNQVKGSTRSMLATCWPAPLKLKKC